MVNGRFYFTQTQNGNLLGEFSNSEVDRNYTESADVIPPFTLGNYGGNYTSTWFDGKAQTLDLTIEEKEGTTGILVLQWRDGDKIVFYGEGFINQNFLIGNYWDDEIEDVLRPLFNN